MTLEKKPICVVLTGAGISAESGIPTFRAEDGLWAGHKVEEVCTPEALKKNRAKVLAFYNERRRNAQAAEPNAAHLALVELEAFYEVHIITQNVDDLHERAGSTNVLHLHGELNKARSSFDESYTYQPLYKAGNIFGMMARDRQIDEILGQKEPEK